MRDFFDKALSQISFQLNNDDSLFADDRGWYEPISSSINLNMGFYDIVIKGQFIFIEPLLTWKRKWDWKPDYDERDLWMLNIANKVTFLFYYNMFQRTASYKTNGGAVLLPSLFDEYLEHTDVGDSLRRNYQEIVNKLFFIIRDDEELKIIFSEVLSYVQKVHQEPLILSFLKKKLEN